MRTDLEFARFIDATLLKPEATKEQMIAHLESAKEHHFKTVAIGCAWFDLAAEILDGSDVGIDAPIGFANGYNTTETKIFETKDAFAKGATEADILLNIGWLKSGMYDKVEDELKRFKEACGDHISKVIFEVCYLDEKEIREAVRIAKRAGLDFVKTSTGFAKGGATFEDVCFMRENVGKNVKIKAAGGISSLDDAEKFLALGCSRLGTSKIVKIIKNGEKK